jgi:hypothetical protein
MQSKSYRTVKTFECRGFDCFILVRDDGKFYGGVECGMMETGFTSLSECIRATEELAETLVEQIGQ